MSTIKKSLASICSVLLLIGLFTTTPQEAQAQSEPFIGQIAYMGFNFCPRGWAPAEGQLLPISQNTALFSLLGTMYGGDGRTTFALPDLRGRSAISQGTGAGLSPYRMGQKSGVEFVTLNTLQIPSHNHPGNAHGTTAATATMTGTATATATATQAKVRQTPGSDSGLGERSGATNDGTISSPNVTVTLENLDISDITIPDPGLAVTTSNVGGNQSHENRAPTLTVQACIALVGIFPSRN